MRIKRHKSICERKKVKPENPISGSVVGVAVDTFEKNNSSIIHGLRHNLSKNSNGWYIWKGEFEERDDFFEPICIEHLHEYVSEGIFEYLNLPFGYRFLLDLPNYEDVWFDKDLVNF